MTLHYSGTVGAERYATCAVFARIYTGPESALEDDKPLLTVVLDTGAASIQFYPSPDEARAMATAMLAAADRAEEVARGFQQGARKSAEVPA